MKKVILNVLGGGLIFVAGIVCTIRFFIKAVTGTDEGVMFLQDFLSNFADYLIYGREGRPRHRHGSYWDYGCRRPRRRYAAFNEEEKGSDS